MATIADLDLMMLPMEAPEFAADPWPYFAAAREQHPWLAQSLFGYVVHQYDAIKDILWMDDHLRTAAEGIVQLMEAEGTPWARMSTENMLAKTGADHKRLRDLLAPLFTPKQANLNRGLMQEVIKGLLDEWVPKGAFDFEDFIANYPIGVMCSMIGAPREEIPRLRSSMEALGLSYSMDKNHVPALQEATVTIDEFSRQVVAERRAGKRPEKGGELLDILLQATGDNGLTERELLDLLLFLFVAGYDTSKNILTLIMYDLLNHPQYYERCAQDLAFCDKVVEESFRYHSVANIPRLSTKEIVYRDVVIPEATMLFFPVSVAGRDPGAFPDPDKYDPERQSQNRHMAFGRGRHICLGQYIARAQIAEGLHQITQRIKNPQLSGEIGWRPFFGVWGIRGLPIKFDVPAA